MNDDYDRLSDIALVQHGQLNRHAQAEALRILRARGRQDFVRFLEGIRFNDSQGGRKTDWIWNHPPRVTGWLERKPCLDCGKPTLRQFAAGYQCEFCAHNAQHRRRRRDQKQAETAAR